MIYDLKELKDRNLRATEYGSPTSDFAVIRSEILLAIAERLEALVEAQKPRWVYLYDLDNDPVIVDISAPIAVRVRKTGGEILVVVNGYTVKGTLAEVMDKLRGDK